jgi:molecular chaperone DnaK (HSP70)
VSFSLKRDELTSICADTLTALKAMISSALSSAGLTAADVHGIELLGGGSRMQVVQAAISGIFDAGVVVGAKFDDCSVALGASLLLAHNTPSLPTEGTVLTSSYCCC